MIAHIDIEQYPTDGNVKVGQWWWRVSVASDASTFPANTLRVEAQGDAWSATESAREAIAAHERLTP